jgi:hypothetical protein
MLNTQLLNFAVKIGEEDKAILMLALLPPSYDPGFDIVIWERDFGV